jgi:hypothetical protein
MPQNNSYTLKVRNVEVITNLEVKLKSRTTKEEANKEVLRMIDSNNLFESYDWKIEGCEEGGIKNFNDKLRTDIIARIDPDDTEDCIFWDGMKAQFEMNIYHINVTTDLEVQLKSKTQEDAIAEIEKICAERKLFDGYDWKICGCPEDAINECGEALQDAIIVRIQQEDKVADCLEGQA